LACPALDFTSSIRKKTVSFRLYPFLFELCGPLPVATIGDARWVAADDVVMASAVGETIPELDEALARVWDPPAQLPSLYRAEARAIFSERPGNARSLALRAAALVAASAPSERVAALRPSL